MAFDGGERRVRGASNLLCACLERAKCVEIKTHQPKIQKQLLFTDIGRNFPNRLHNVSTSLESLCPKDT